MNYVSTRGGIRPVTFQDAVMMGLADDGGLIIPEAIPDARPLIDTWRDLDYAELAGRVLGLYIDDIPEADLRELIGRTYADAFEPDVAPTVKVDSLYVTELWHGPTLAFKDVALQLLGNLFEYILERRGGRLTILGATSGDTGSAAICGVRGRKGIDIFIMHPHGRVSPIQAKQMTTVLDENVHNIAVEGSFDDCQNIMKTLAAELDFKRRYSLGAVNSVNWARVLAQVVYYFKAAFDVQKVTAAEKVRIEVPTGNFGDVLAGWYAMQMGAPISRLILATNENDILARFFNTGEYSRSEVSRTYSPSMDIQVASNFERYLYYKLGCDPAVLGEVMAGFANGEPIRVPLNPDGVVDPAFAAGVGHTDEMLDVIHRYWRERRYLMDPHTAVGVAVAEQQGLEGDPVICLSTAHPAKFPAAIEEATGEDIATHPAIEELMDLPTRCEVLPNDVNAVREYIIQAMG